MIADTTFIIDLLRNDPGALRKEATLRARGRPPSLTAITVFELACGLARSSKPLQELERLKTVLDGQQVHPFDAHAAQLAGNREGVLHQQGAPIGTRDLMIAGIALARNEPVLTRNRKEFSRIEGLIVETY